MFSKKIRSLGNSLLFRLTILYAATITFLAVISFLVFYCRIYSVTMERMDFELLEDTEMYSEYLDYLGLAGIKKKLQRIVTNLLENAIKYTPEKRTVNVSAVVQDGEIRLIFEDNGIGISEKDLPHIFERFYRCDQSRSQGGVGLGLSLAKAFAESMKGMIQVNSTMNQGSTFTLKFAR